MYYFTLFNNDHVEVATSRCVGHLLALGIEGYVVDNYNGRVYDVADGRLAC